MIRSLRIQNFRCLRDVRLELGPLNVLIGPNDGGKSSILDAMVRLGRVAREPEWRIGFDDVPFKSVLSHFGTDASISFRLEVQHDEGGTATYALSLAENGVRESLTSTELRAMTFSRVPENRRVAVTYAEGSLALQVGDGQTVLGIAAQNASLRNDVAHLTQSLPRRAPFRFDPAVMRGASAPEQGEYLWPRGENLAAVLDRLWTGPDVDARRDIDAGLHAAIPSLLGLALRVANRAEKVVEYRLAGRGGPRSTSASLVSDGAILYTAFLVLARDPSEGPLLVEEPDRGLHPSQLGELMRLLRTIAEGNEELGLPPRQVIVTTHSPALLDHARTEEVYVVDREGQAGTRVTALRTVPSLAERAKGSTLGQLWLAGGERGLIGG